MERKSERHSDHWWNKILNVSGSTLKCKWKKSNEYYTFFNFNTLEIENVGNRFL